MAVQEKSRVITSPGFEYGDSPSKRRRLSSGQGFSDRSWTPLPSIVLPKNNIARGYGNLIPRFEGPTDDDHAEGEESITISATSKQATQTVAPFLARHIPEQYAPMGGLDHSDGSTSKETNTKYCYRHRPDLKCRRQVNEPSMDQLQHELEALSQGDQQAIAHVWSLFSAAPPKHRNLMLQGILTQCCFPQLSFISSNVRDLIKLDFISALPPEISFKILCYLDTTSLCKAAQVSQRWRTLADDDVVWHKMCEQHIDRKCLKCGWGLPLLERKRLRASKRQIQLRATGRGLNEWSPNITPFPEATSGAHDHDFPEDASTLPGTQHPSLPANALANALEPHSKQPLAPSKTDAYDSYSKPRFRPWKDVYKDRFKVGTNWKYGRCSTKVFNGHTNGVMCLQFDDHILASGSYDATIKIWDINSGEELRTLRGHASGIRCLQFDDTKLISGSLDHTIKVWNWRTGECISSYNGHSDGVITLHFDSTILASGSRDKTVKIWNFEDKSTFVLRGHTDWVNSVKVDTASRTVFSASDDCTVRLWDLDTKTCIKTFEGHVGQVQQVVPLPLEFDFEDADADAHDDTASTTSTHSQHPQQTAGSPSPSPSPATTTTTHSHTSFGPTFSSEPTRPLPPRYMLTGALDSTIRLWSVSTQKCLRTYFGHVEGIWALAADTLRVVSGAQDCMVKVWDARSGRCERTFTGHAGAVTCIGLSDVRMVTGGEDGDVRVYRF